MLRVSAGVHREIADVYGQAADFLETIEAWRAERIALANLINARGSRVLS